MHKLFFARFLVLWKSKRGHARISEVKKMTKISDNVFFICVIFLLKRVICTNHWVITEIREWPIFALKARFVLQRHFFAQFSTFFRRKNGLQLYLILLELAQINCDKYFLKDRKKSKKYHIFTIEFLIKTHCFI